MVGPPPPPRGAMSLYADLLSGSTGDADATAAAPTQPEPPKNPALRFQPVIRRPQQPKPKPKPKPKPNPKPAVATVQAAAATTMTGAAAAASPSAGLPIPPAAATAAPAPRTSLADWTAGGDEDDEDDGAGFFPEQKWQQRGGRKRRKKRLEDKQRMAREAAAYVDWDELYDPARPTNIEAYLNSDERIAAAREWKSALHAHRRLRRSRADSRGHDDSPSRNRSLDSSGRGSDGSSNSSDSDDARRHPHRQEQFNSAFAPPAIYATSTPPAVAADNKGRRTKEAGGEGNDGRNNDDNDDAYAQRPARPSASTGLYAAVPPPQAAQAAPGAPAVPAASSASAASTAQPAPTPPTAASPLLSPPPASATRNDGLVVSKPPVRFELASTAAAPRGDDGDAMDDTEDGGGADVAGYPKDAVAARGGDGPGTLDGPRTNRPGQAGFASRFMAKYGWTRGSGLGADESGIVNPLRHKRVKGSTTLGRIVGGGGGSASVQNNSNSNSNANLGSEAAVSPVIVLRNMIDDLPDLAVEVADGQLVQEIGEECGEQYGRIERVYIDVTSRLVFIKFTEAVSALRAVNALSGRIFNGNAIAPSFYDADKFEQGIYE